MLEPAKSESSPSYMLLLKGDDDDKKDDEVDGWLSCNFVSVELINACLFGLCSLYTCHAQCIFWGWGAQVKKQII